MSRFSALSTRQPSGESGAVDQIQGMADWRSTSKPKLNIAEKLGSLGLASNNDIGSNDIRKPSQESEIPEGKVWTTTASIVSLSKRPQPRRRWKAGVVFSGVLHEPDCDKKTTRKIDMNRSETIHGPVYSKHRKFVVIACFEYHFLALPIYTHSGTGLSKKTNREEFISVRDADAGPNIKPAESSYNVLISQRTEALRNDPGSSKWNIMSNETSVWLTHPVCHKYRSTCSIIGALQEKSTRYLLKVYIDLMTIKIKGPFAPGFSVASKPICGPSMTHSHAANARQMSYANAFSNSRMMGK
jgi:hypothetical protein